MKLLCVSLIGTLLSFSIMLVGCAKTFNLTYPCTPETFKKYDSFVKRNAPSEDAFVAVQRIAEPYIQEKQWEKAAEIFKAYRPLFEPKHGRFDKIIAMLEADEEELVVTNLGPGINTEADEYEPIPKADGSTLYFTSNDRNDSNGGEDVYFSVHVEGKFQNAENLGSGINTDKNESLNSISADGNRIILFGNYAASYGFGDNFYADKTSKGWSEIKHFPKPINSKSFDSDAMITSDGKAIIFASDRDGCIGDFNRKGFLFHGSYVGNLDIYICIQGKDGWSESINLGPVINTPYCDRTPFLHPDGKTLYFSSEGHYGLGRLDVFKAVRLSEDSWKEWSEPVNLGKEINSAGHDWGYRIATSGEVAFFSTCEKSDGFGGEDIYSITLPQEVRPDVVATVRGKVTDNEGNPLEAGIKWEDLSSQIDLGQLKSDPSDGSYFIVLPLGKNYGYHAEKDGYYPASKNIDLREETEPLEIVEDIVLVMLKEIKEQEISVRINNIFFDFDRYDLLPESFPELNRLAEVLKDYPEATVKISGHTDSIGTDAYNLELSRKRAQAVVDYLISVGCSGGNLLAEGYGEKIPIAGNDTGEGRARNRRVEFSF